jgi:hypothetical protein
MSALNYLPGGAVLGVKPQSINAFIDAQKSIYGPIPLPAPTGITHKKEAPPPIAEGEPLLQSDKYSASMSAYYKAKQALIDYVKKYEAKRQKVSRKASVHNYFEKRMKQENKLVSDTLEIFGYTPQQIQEEKRAVLKQIAESKSFIDTTNVPHATAVRHQQEEQKKMDAIVEGLQKNPALVSALSSVGPIEDIVKGERFNLPSTQASANRLGLEPQGIDSGALTATYSYLIDKAYRRIPKETPKPSNFVTSDEHVDDNEAIDENIEVMDEGARQVETDLMSSVSGAIPQAPLANKYNPVIKRWRVERAPIIRQYVIKIIDRGDKALIDEIVSLGIPRDARTGLPYITSKAYDLLSYANISSDTIDKVYNFLYNNGRFNDILG